MFYSSDVRYEDEDGKLVDYDASLTAVSDTESTDGTSLEGYAYENAQGDMKHYIPENISQETPLRLENGGYSLEVAPLFGQTEDVQQDQEMAAQETEAQEADVQEAEVQEEKVQAEEAQNAALADMSDKANLFHQVSELESVDIDKEQVVDIYGETEEKQTTAVYSAEDGSFGLEYIPFESGVKENLVLYEQPETNVWQFAFTLGGDLTAKKDDSVEGISFYNEEGSIVGGIQVPYMNDAIQENYSEAITYDLDEAEGIRDTYILTMTVDKAYLESEETVYPVTIDPTYSWTGSSSIYDVYVLSGYPSNNYYSSSVTGMFAGRTNANGYERTYMSFSGLADKVSGYSVASAKLTVYETGGGTSGETVQAHMVTGAWNKSTLTWNNRPSYNTTALSSFVNTAAANKAGTLDITSYVRKVANGASDYGIMLRTKDEAVSKYAKFYGSRHSSTAYRPKLTVTYIDKPTEASNVSVASYWLKKGNTVSVSWAGINSSALKSIQYRVALLSDDGKEFVDTEYAPYASNPVIGSSASGTASINTSALGEGCFRIYVRGLDQYGSVGAGKGATFVLDGTAPTLSSASVTPSTTEAAPGSNAQPVIKWSGASDKYLKQVQYSIDGGSYASMGTTASGSFTVPAGKITTSGKHTIKVRAIDKSGNTSSVKTLYYYYTADKPVIGSFHVSEDSNGVQLFLSGLEEAEEVFQGGSASWAVVSHGSQPASSDYTAISGSSTDGRLVSAITNFSKTEGIYDVYVKVKDDQGTWSEPAVAVLYHFPDAVYDGSVSLSAESLTENAEESASWKLKWDTGSDSSSQSEQITSADVYISLDGEAFVKKQAVTSGEIQLDFADVKNYAMYRICATYADGSKKLSDVITLEKVQKEDAVEETENDLVSSMGAEAAAELEEGAVEEIALFDVVAASEEGTSQTVYYYRLSSRDTDSDGLEDGYEIWDFGSDADNEDTDGDGLEDRYEVVILGTNPAVYTADADSDKDGLTNLQEQEKGTNPYLADSDFDGINDSTDTAPKKTDTSSGQTINYQVSAHAGLYDLEEDGLLYNPYSSLSKKSVNSDGTYTLYFYDKNDNLTAELAKANGKYYLNTYTYNSSGQKTYMTYNGLPYAYTYDSLDNILTVDVNGSRLVQYIYGYDYEEDQETGASYKSDSYLTRINYANGGNIRYQYEDMDILVVKEDEDGNVTTETKTEHKLAYVKVDGKATDSSTYTYNQYGNVTKYIDSDSGVTYTYSYDAKQNLTGITGNNGFSMGTTTTDNSNTENGETSYTTDTTWNLGDVEKTVHYSYQSSETNNTETAATDLLTGKKLTVQKSLETGNSTTTVGSTISWTTTEGETQGSIVYKDGSRLIYTYDSNGNITRISEKASASATEGILATYSYDGMNQLIRENNRQANATTLYTYDTNGNLTGSKIYAYTEGTVSGSASATHTWSYGNSSWRDQLTKYDGTTITYDAGGNPLTYRNGSTLTWQGGRQLKQYEDNAQTIGYTYNDSGIRTKKTVTDKSTGDTVTRTYYLDDSNILAEKVSGSGDADRTVWYAYSGDGTLAGFMYNNADYYYQKNLQGDIIGIYNAAGELVVTYEYDAWGNLTDMTDTSGSDLGEINPFRYRSYYYDEDAGWYYLQSRYYDAEVGRFLNADDSVTLSYELMNLERINLFWYSGNDPINKTDENGNWPSLTFVKNKLKSFANKSLKFNIKFSPSTLPCASPSALPCLIP